MQSTDLTVDCNSFFVFDLVLFVATVTRLLCDSGGWEQH